MSLVDSNAVFESRARTIGISDRVLTNMGLRGWTTHATYAFSVATQPGADEQAFMDGVITPILGNPDHPDAPKLRRLFFASHTLTSAELRRKVDSTETEAPRKLPAPRDSTADRDASSSNRSFDHFQLPGALSPSHQRDGPVC